MGSVNTVLEMRMYSKTTPFPKADTPLSTCLQITHFQILHVVNGIANRNNTKTHPTVFFESFLPRRHSS